jgi:hypothetical protein
MSRGGNDTQETTQTAEPWGPSEPYLQDIMGEAANLYASGTGMQYYPGSTVVPMSGQTSASLTGQENLGYNMMGGSPYFNQSADIMGGYAGGLAPSTYAGGQALSDYRNVLSNQVMDDVQGQFAGMGRTGSSPMAQVAATEAFSNAYVPTALQYREMELGRQQQANAMGQQQQMMAAQAMPGIQNMMDQRAMMGTNILGGTGQQREGYAGQYLQEDMQRYQFEQMSPYQRLQQYAGTVVPIAGQFPLTTMTQPQPQYNAMTGALGGAMSGAAMGSQMSWAGPWGMLGGAALGYMSDRRLKESYRVIGKSPSGINIYQFKYKGYDEVYEGVMADEVPYAAYEDASGYDMVDYNKVDVTFRRVA